MRLPDIVGVALTGRPAAGITATDVVLALTEFLRQQKVVGAYLEFYGEGAAALTLGDRATISNMTPEFGATAAMFSIENFERHSSVENFTWVAMSLPETPITLAPSLRNAPMCSAKSCASAVHPDVNDCG